MVMRVKQIEGCRLLRPTAAFIGMGLDRKRDWIVRMERTSGPARWWAIRALTSGEYTYNETRKNGKKRTGVVKVNSWHVMTLFEPEVQHREQGTPIELGEFGTLGGAVRAIKEWMSGTPASRRWGMAGNVEQELPERDLTLVVQVRVPAGVPDRQVQTTLRMALADHLLELTKQDLMHGTEVRSVRANVRGELKNGGRRYGES